MATVNKILPEKVDNYKVVKFGEVKLNVKNSFTTHPGIIDYKGKSYFFYHNGSLPTGGIFEHQYAAPGSYPTMLTVTDAEVTRYFMTIPEACQLILQSVAIGSREAVYTLDMGEPVLIRLLAEQMIRLAGKQPGRDIAIVYTGLRAGEKLHETLFHADERYRPTVHPKILQAEARAVSAEKIRHSIESMRGAVASFDLDTLATLLRDALPEFRPADRAAWHTAPGTVVAFPARQARKT